MRYFSLVPFHILMFLLLNSQISMAVDSLYFPPTNGGNWEKIDISTIGWDLDSLNEALNYAKEQKSSGVIILLNGRILVERYWKVRATGFFKLYDKVVFGKTKDGRVIEDVASIQKSIISVLSGIAQGRGILDFDAPVDYYLGKNWSEAPRQKEKVITIRHLLSMTSGLNANLGYDTPAGQKWKYNTPAYSQLVKVLETITRTDINQLTKDWLIAPIGMIESTWAQRDSKGLFSFFSKEANSIGFMTTARDLARFGLLMLAKGSWKGENVINNPAYHKEAFTPQRLKPTYGYLWWLNTDELLIPNTPDDTFLAWGNRTRQVYVVPSFNLVVVRIGDEPEKSFTKNFLPLVLKSNSNVEKQVQ